MFSSCGSGAALLSLHRWPKALLDSGPSRLIVQHSGLRSNGEPNCQGIPAEYVLNHYLDTAYLDVHGDTLRIFTAPEGQDPFLTAVRVR